MSYRDLLFKGTSFNSAEALKREGFGLGPRLGSRGTWFTSSFAYAAHFANCNCHRLQPAVFVVVIDPGDLLDWIKEGAVRLFDGEPNCEGMSFNDTALARLKDYPLRKEWQVISLTPEEPAAWRHSPAPRAAAVTRREPFEQPVARSVWPGYYPSSLFQATKSMWRGIAHG